MQGNILIALIKCPLEAIKGRRNLVFAHSFINPLCEMEHHDGRSIWWRLLNSEQLKNRKGGSWEQFNPQRHDHCDSFLHPPCPQSPYILNPLGH